MKQDGQYVMDLAVGNPNGFLVVSVVLTHFQVVLVNFVFFLDLPWGTSFEAEILRNISI